MNDGHEYRERLRPVDRGKTLLGYLVERYRHSSEREWAARIAAGRVLLDGRPADAGTTLEAGQELCWRRPPWVEPDVPLGFAVLHRDADLLAVAKPAGLPVVPAGGFLRHTLLALVRRYEPAAVPAHRIGRGTSGLVLFARHRQARVALAEAWRAGRVVRRYRALAWGRPEQAELELDQPIGPVPHRVLGALHAATPTGKPARTRIVVLEHRDDAFLADAFLTTGRPHQIRIHLAAAGHPLVGDPLYETGGIPAGGSGALPGDPGYHLHAAQLRLPHPRSGREITLVCAPPAILRRGNATGGDPLLW